MDGNVLTNVYNSIIIVNINLEHIKNKEKDSRPKKFTFRLKGLPIFYIILYILAIERRSTSLAILL
ncbi:uncharacterized protein K441DRAFT_712441 [Cenococcum geophilum 1.58]|uniref:uncharacterized protein n=1 Tax=Cenococcum geophilum 1.58 TaxID=794803 RepID=UPI00358FC0EA|nr:hypothetical protein K441DRAFT_712441 [Cenococcum geophilum 1.58]